jgi:hypothetical protein
MIVNCTQLMCKKCVVLLFFNLTFQYVLYFGRAKFILPSTVLLVAVRSIICSEVLGRPISVIRNRVSINKMIVQSKYNNIIFNNVTFVSCFG